jgi:hypothetical protein
MSGASLPAGEGSLATLSFDPTLDGLTLSLENVLVSGQGGSEIVVSGPEDVEIPACENTDNDSICDVSDDCVGQLDDCGICNGPGIADGSCDCDGNILDCFNECGGTASLDACDVCGGSGPDTFYFDGDADGYGDPAAALDACDEPEGYVDNSDDSDDSCYNNDYQDWYYDNDGDGLGDPNATLLACNAPGDEWVTNGDDSDDECFYNTYSDWYADVDGDGLCDYNDLTESSLCDDFLSEGSLPDGCEQDPYVTCIYIIRRTCYIRILFTSIW